MRNAVVVARGGCIKHVVLQILITLAVLGLSALASAPAFAHDTVYYFMTDALHSTVVVTDQNRNIVEETHYGPYGLVLNRQLRDGPGYGGHTEDPATGLVYMQQRYYDPQVGRFLSVDPVGVEPTSGGNFNRYWYAKDNPYRYTDPDGRQEADDGAVEQEQLREELHPLLRQESPTEYKQDLARQEDEPKTLGKLQAENTKLLSGDAGRDAQRKIDKFVKKYTKGGKFSRSTKQTTAERASHQCEYCGRPTTPAQQSRRGVTPPSNEAQTDHIVPRSKGGTNSPDNAAHACRACNQSMSNKPKPAPPRVQHDGDGP